jgi:hypothetical protein
MSDNFIAPVTQECGAPPIGHKTVALLAATAAVASPLATGGRSSSSTNGGRPRKPAPFLRLGACDGCSFVDRAHLPASRGGGDRMRFDYRPEKQLLLGRYLRPAP